MAEELLANGAYIDVKNNMGSTALHLTAEYNSQYVIEVLLNF